MNPRNGCSCRVHPEESNVSQGSTGEDVLNLTRYHPEFKCHDSRLLIICVRIGSHCYWTAAGERENPSLNRAAASSGFFMPEVLLRLQLIDQESGWWCITVGLGVSLLEVTPGKMDYNEI